MESWIVWSIVAGIGLVVAILIQALTKRARGSGILGVIVIGILGALIGAALMPAATNLPRMGIVEERYVWAAIGAVVLSLLYELAVAGNRRGRILIPAPRR